MKDGRQDARREELVLRGESVVEPEEGSNTPVLHGEKDIVVEPLSP